MACLELRATIAAVLLAFSASCYRFSTPNRQLPEGIASVHVPMLVNNTSEPSAEGFFTQALRDELLRAGRLGDGGSEATLLGSIVSVGSGAVVSSTRRPVYRLSATMELRLVKGTRVVASTTVSQGEDFPAGSDVLIAENYRAAALRRLAESMAQEGFERLATVW